MPVAVTVAPCAKHLTAQATVSKPQPSNTTVQPILWPELDIDYVNN